MQRPSRPRSTPRREPGHLCGVSRFHHPSGGPERSPVARCSEAPRTRVSCERTSRSACQVHPGRSRQSARAGPSAAAGSTRRRSAARGTAHALPGAYGLRRRQASDSLQDFGTDYVTAAQSRVGVSVGRCQWSGAVRREKAPRGPKGTPVSTAAGGRPRVIRLGEPRPFGCLLTGSGQIDLRSSLIFNRAWRAVFRGKRYVKYMLTLSREGSYYSI